MTRDNVQGNSEVAVVHVIHYTVMDEPQETTEHELTAKTIMSNAGFDPAENYLEELVGKEKKSYKDKPDALIHMHEHQKFLVVFTGTVPVS